MVGSTLPVRSRNTYFLSSDDAMPPDDAKVPFYVRRPAHYQRANEINNVKSAIKVAIE